MQRFGASGRHKCMKQAQIAGSPEVEQVYRENRLALLRLAFLLTGSRTVSEDVVHNAFTAAMVHWDRIEQPLPYLKRAIANQAADVHRRAKRMASREGTQPVTHIPEVDETWAIVQRLPVRQRTVVVLRFYEDLPLVEIAELLARPASTVRSDLKRALDRLRKEIPK